MHIYSLLQWQNLTLYMVPQVAKLLQKSTKIKWNEWKQTQSLWMMNRNDKSSISGVTGATSTSFVFRTWMNQPRCSADSNLSCFVRSDFMKKRKENVEGSLLEIFCRLCFVHVCVNKWGEHSAVKIFVGGYFQSHFNNRQFQLVLRGQENYSSNSEY